MIWQSFFLSQNVAANITSIPKKVPVKKFNETNVNGRYIEAVARELWKNHIPYCKDAFCNKKVSVFYYLIIIYDCFAGCLILLFFSDLLKFCVYLTS
jgi:hypothetical protein